MCLVHELLQVAARQARLLERAEQAEELAAEAELEHEVLVDVVVQRGGEAHDEGVLALEEDLLLRDDVRLHIYVWTVTAIGPGSQEYRSRRHEISFCAPVV